MIVNSQGEYTVAPLIFPFQELSTSSSRKHGGHLWNKHIFLENTWHRATLELDLVLSISQEARVILNKKLVKVSRT